MPGLAESIGSIAAAGIRQWVRMTGKRIARGEASWLDCPMGRSERIGAEFYSDLAEREHLQIRATAGAGLLPDFAALKGRRFDPTHVRPEIRDFYEHTSSYR